MRAILLAEQITGCAPADMAFDAFISHSAKDKAIAEGVASVVTYTPALVFGVGWVLFRDTLYYGHEVGGP